MSQLGESIAVPELVQDEVHSKATCPWHDDPPPPATPPAMDEQADDDDASEGQMLAPVMPKNSGKKLGQNKGDKEDTEIKVSYPGATAPKEEKLQWAPHHLIPGNASLKGSSVVAFLGDDTVIAKFKGGIASKIKDKQTINYDVNSSANGVWLPSPYALSMSGKWPTNPESKLAYVEAAIDQNGGSMQFHMAHTKYSGKVREILDTLGNKLDLLTESGKCEKADADKTDKFDAPLALIGRLNAISVQMQTFAAGPVWRAPLFLDDTLMAMYLTKKQMKEVAGLKGEVTPVKIGSK